VDCQRRKDRLLLPGVALAFFDRNIGSNIILTPLIITLKVNIVNKEDDQIGFGTMAGNWGVGLLGERSGVIQRLFSERNYNRYNHSG
jgi:hypothetical protein